MERLSRARPIWMHQKKLYIQTFGCQMNVYDSERVAQLMADCGYRLVDSAEEADLIFVNTCSIREKPEKKVFSALGRFRKIKERNPAVAIGVGGCVAQQEGERLLAHVPYIDFVLGTKELSRLPELLKNREKFGKRSLAAELNGRVDPYACLPLHPAPAGPTAFVSIMQGCDNFCSYCIVPFVRGREVSRASGAIIEEIRLLSEKGVKDVTLLGQNVNSYGNKASGELNFTDLLGAIEEIPGIERIRFTTSHPKDLSLPLMEAFQMVSKLCGHIHLPLQSGSNQILEMMNRGYTIEEYSEKIRRLRKISPDIRITTDFIVGFPGETDDDFKATLRAIEEIQFDEFFSFIYSDRPHTRASLLAGKVPAETGRRRLLELQGLQQKITRKKNHSWVGRVVEVLVEGPSKANPADLTGKTRANHIVNFPGETAPTGSLVRVCIERAFAHSLRGEIV